MTCPVRHILAASGSLIAKAHPTRHGGQLARSTKKEAASPSGPKNVSTDPRIFASTTNPDFNERAPVLMIAQQSGLTWQLP
jgi:hypothetical protein